jgi:integrase
MDFHRVLDSLPSRWRPFFVTLALSGLQTAELCGLEPRDLDHEERAIRPRGSERGVRVIYVAASFWPWVVAAVPVPVRYSYLRLHWQAAVDRAGLRNVSVRDLQRLRTRLLRAAGVGCHPLRPLLTVSDEDLRAEVVHDRRRREEARLLVELLPVLALTEDEGRRLVLKVVRSDWFGGRRELSAVLE